MSRRLMLQASQHSALGRLLQLMLLHLYEENVHVPLIVAAPGLTLGSVRVPQVASLTDLAPTTLALR